MLLKADAEKSLYVSAVTDLHVGFPLHVGQTILRKAKQRTAR